MDGISPALVSGRDRLGPRRSGRPGLSPTVLAAAAVLHLGLVGAVALLARGAALRPPRAEAAMQMMFAAGPAPAQTVTALSAAPIPPMASAPRIAAALAPTVPVVVTETAPAPDTLARPVRRLVPRHAVRVAGDVPAASAPAAPGSPTPPAATAPQAVAAPPGAAAPSVSMLRALAGWEAGISQAVQAAAIYPAAARLQHRQGRARVQFEYRQGAVAQALVVQASQSAILDQAALAAVMRARLPPPPAAIGPQARTMVVWVTFGLSAPD